ncbi:MAG TPA: DUF4215 domain-containing protein [Candidatus Binatia bacterium]|jgi:cysteine-rich repeat protein
MSGGHRIKSSQAVAAIFVAVCMCAASTARAGTPATTSADVCASNANPCNVTSTFDVANNAVLDFGTRTVNVSGAGQFNFGTGSGRIDCGSFTASTSSAFLNAAGATSSGSSSGSVLLQARRLCTSANPLVPCLDDGDCQLGPCGVRRCSLKTTRTCTGDTDCQLGHCGSLHRCSGSTTYFRCSTNADCDLGTCPSQITCTGRGDNPVNCADNSDCEYGSCSVGTASISLGGSVTGSSDNPATIVIRAADSVSIAKPVTLNSTSVDSDGGSLSVDARTGSITISNNINATGGGASTGGDVELNAGTDVVLQSDINVLGGDFDGGTIDLTARRDVTVTSSLIANSGAGAGFGGDISVTAGRDFSFHGVSASNKSTIETSGHMDSENDSGDGGSQDLEALRNVLLDANTRLIGNGSTPDGEGSDVTIESGAGLEIDGDVTAKAAGAQGDGGFAQITADGGTATIGPAAAFDLSGGSAGGGVLDLESISGDLSFAGDADVSGGSGGAGGSAVLVARQDASISGAMSVAGTGGGSLGAEACGLTLQSGSSLDNNVDNGANTLISHDTMKLLAGSTVTSGASGSNTLRYRSVANPPQVQGTVAPAATLVADATLAPCPLCGNRRIDPGESCDDGNAVDGDGCSADCQNENCLSQTAAPGYPAVPLCEDGDPCTTDICNTSVNNGTCQHTPKSCDDGVACTTDSCNTSDGTCRHSADDSACNDSNPCTDDFCSLTSGCSNTANSSPCDDHNRCTNNDVCSNKACHGTRINGCLFCGDGFVNPLAGEQCDDGNNENGDCCSSTCKFEAAGSSCEDGYFCTINDTCDGNGDCVTGVPNSCADTDACTQDSCSEDLAACVHAPVPRDAAACLVAPASKLQINNSNGQLKDKLSWQWSHGDAFAPEDFGTPGTDTHYTLCIYDEASTVSSLKASIDIAPSTHWISKVPSLLQYKDKTGSSEGVLKVQLRSGNAGRTQAKVLAGHANLTLPSPAGATFFHEEPNVTVQLVNDAGMCWMSQFAVADTGTNSAAIFKAQTK